MRQRFYAAVALTALLLTACTGPEPAAETVSVSGTTRVLLQKKGAGDVSVYAFRRQGESYLFDTLYRDGWTPEGTLRVRMANGDYKFLFVKGADDGFVTEPEPLTRQTAWEVVAFALRPNGAGNGTFLPAGELFLQDSPAAANTNYTVAGTELTVPARLTRAVFRIGFWLKRGYRSGNEYKEVSYAEPHSVLDEIGRVEVTVRNAGLRANPDGSSGKAAVSASLAASEYAEMTGDGFVRLDGPFVLPPAEGAEVELELSVVPAAGASLDPVSLQLTGRAERNKRLDVTLWITSGSPEIGVEIRTVPIEREQDGDAGIWE